MRARTSLATVALVLSAAAAEAHHGRDFLLARTADLPHPGQVFFVPRVDAVRQDRTTAIELEPSLIVGAAERLALEMHAHIAREDESGFHYESLAPAVHVRLTPEAAAWAAGASLEYEITRDAGVSNRIETRAVVSRQTAASRLAVNIFAGHGGLDEDTGVQREGLDWNYAAGLRRRVARSVDVGFEGGGELARSGVHELLAGIYMEPSNRITVNVGLGGGIGSNAPGFTVRTAVVVRLR